jgi:hypothetical protein
LGKDEFGNNVYGRNAFCQVYAFEEENQVTVVSILTELLMPVQVQPGFPILMASSSEEEDDSPSIAVSSSGSVPGLPLGTGAPAVIVGESMDDLKTVAKQLQSEGYDVKWYQTWGKNWPKGRRLTPMEIEMNLARDEAWMTSKVEDGYIVSSDPTVLRKR